MPVNLINANKHIVAMPHYKEHKASSQTSGSVPRVEKKKQRVRFFSDSEGDNLSSEPQNANIDSGSET
eukprot:Ihof_evm9s308 gene=Ihof_evmTU9s308